MLIEDFGIESILKHFELESPHPGSSTGQEWNSGKGADYESVSPVDGERVGEVRFTDHSDFEGLISRAETAFGQWKNVPAPQRGEVVRQIGLSLREYKGDLGKLVSYEMGKSYQEGLGEVQEMIDICDFAVGQSRQLYGLSMHSERTNHRMYEQYHPLGPVGIISAFNFPVAVWAWNSMLAWVCGDVCIWKPSEKTFVTSIVAHKIVAEVFRRNGYPEGICNLLIGDQSAGEWLTNDSRVPLISATGSTRMGKKVAEAVGRRLGRTILELGGNNAIIISKKANLELALRGAMFGAVGTAGQRCTTTRRLVVHQEIYEEFVDGLIKAYDQLRIGNPLDEDNHVGPLIDREAVNIYMEALAKLSKEGGQAVVEGEVLEGTGYESGCYVRPSVYLIQKDSVIARQETFAPILYLIKFSEMGEAIEIQNSVPQGLSSAIMTSDLRESELFLSASGSDCGIANVNIGTSGAEIGGAFGGEKETGGGRESGSDAWKIYMRRQTNTINFSSELPLAQGIKFDF